MKLLVLSHCWQRPRGLGWSFVTQFFTFCYVRACVSVDLELGSLRKPQALEFLSSQIPFLTRKQQEEKQTVPVFARECRVV